MSRHRTALGALHAWGYWERALLEAVNTVAVKQGDMAAKQESIAAVVVQTHDLSNSSKTAMEKLELGLRAELKAADLARTNDAKLAAVELAAARMQTADVARQLTALALRVPALATPGTEAAPIILNAEGNPCVGSTHVPEKP